MNVVVGRLDRGWEGEQVGDPGACLVTRDGRLVVWGPLGRLLLAETGGKAYRELARVDRVFATHAWPHVALASGRVVKDRSGRVACFVVGAGG